DNFDLGPWETAIGSHYSAIADWVERADINYDEHADNFDASPFEQLLTSGEQKYAGHSFLIGFAGMERNDETDLNLSGTRYYDTALGSWISKDWDGLEHGNPYVYVTNSPTNYTDPTGRWGEGLPGYSIGMASFEEPLGNARPFTQGERLRYEALAQAELM